MGSSSSPLELTLSLKRSYVPKSINHLLTDLDQIDSVSRKLSVLKDYLNKHKEELHKVEQFKRELPQCVLLLMDAIQEIQEQILVIKNGSVETDQPEEPSFSPSKDDRFSPSKDDRVTMVRPNKCSRKGNENVEVNSTKGSNPMLKLNINANDYAVPVVNNDCPSLSQPILRNNRRIWTPELHSRFLKALNDLGGAGVATPKQVREMMQVKGLTNDQVKSHLQKYRIYKRAGVPGPEARASSISAESADHLHRPAAMASPEQWTPQSQFPCTTRDFFSTVTSIPQYSNSSQHQGDDDPGMHNYGI